LAFKSGARASSGRRSFSDRVRDAKDVISGVLRLGRRADQKFPIIAKLLEPTGNVCGLIRDDCARIN
jgi:hypothetical protein